MFERGRAGQRTVAWTAWLREMASRPRAARNIRQRGGERWATAGDAQLPQLATRSLGEELALRRLTCANESETAARARQYMPNCDVIDTANT